MRWIRFILAAAGFVSACIGPWWFALVCAGLLSLRFAAWEAIVIGALIDLLWLPPGALPWCTISMIVFVWLLAPVRAEFLTQ